MVSEVSGPMATQVNLGPEKTGGRSFRNKKNTLKVPKKIHKAEREKLKRDYMNELFLELGNVLEPTRQNNGKASILDDATRLLRDLLTQVKSLKKENVALLSESHYVTAEKNELKDENATLESHIESLQSELRGEDFIETRLGCSTFSKDHLTIPVVETALQSQPILGPVLVIPLCHDVQASPETEAIQTPNKILSNVSRPHARYPTPADSWPSQLLGEKQKAA
ncbi:hypothetical protein MKW92_041034 [Papaver armeniacum]|nr:hypothetical protein MKW92_041034 [Papaver armeniacum]